jgi:hypothetical protein
MGRFMLGVIRKGKFDLIEKHLRSNEDIIIVRSETRKIEPPHVSWSEVTRYNIAPRAATYTQECLDKAFTCLVPKGLEPFDTVAPKYIIGEDWEKGSRDIVRIGEVYFEERRKEKNGRLILLRLYPDLESAGTEDVITRFAACVYIPKVLRI